MLTNYKDEVGGYFKVLGALLFLTVITFTIPYMVPHEYSFLVQMLTATLKAWVIVMFYMHLKGEQLIGKSVLFSMLIVAFFFVIVMIDVFNFQFADVSHITSPAAVK